MPTATKVRARVTVTKFTDRDRPFSVMRDRVALRRFVPCSTPADYNPIGYNTPLRDATVKYINHLEALRRPDQVTIGVLMDESGSMSGKEHAVVAGINDF